MVNREVFWRAAFGKRLNAPIRDATKPVLSARSSHAPGQAFPVRGSTRVWIALVPKGNNGSELPSVVTTRTVTCLAKANNAAKRVTS